MDNEDATREVASFYRGYIAAFNENDLDAYCDCFEPGSITIKAENRSIAGTVDGIRARAVELRDRLLTSGWTSTRVRRSRIWSIEPRLAVIVSDLERLGGDHIFEVARCIYSVSRTDAGWKIWSTTVSTAALEGSDGLLSA